MKQKQECLNGYMQQVKVLLVQLASNGDCLFVTAIARQIKEVDYPGCHLTWLIGSRFAAVISNNPYIDTVIEVPVEKKEDIISQRNLITEHVANTGGYNTFDKIFITDYTEINYRNWFGTTRSSLFRSYPHPLRVNPQPLIFLTDAEKSRVAAFCRANEITKNTFNILFECAPQSGQSLMTFEAAKTIATGMVAVTPGLKFILSSGNTFVPENPGVIDGSVLSWRENAALANYCNLMVGCSSGISWLCTADGIKALPFIQIINPQYMGGRFSASMKTDFKYFGVDTNGLIELHNPADNILKECILAAHSNQFETARKQYDVNDYSCFSNYRFLKESKLKGVEKSWLFMRYCLPAFIYKTYRQLKPDWFRPVVWMKNRNN